MVASRVYPDLERKPGGPDNWVEAAGGLPPYIERIAKHLHYERGYSISRAIATAVNTVKRWAKGGTVTKYGTTRTVSPATVAKALAAVASWEAKKKAGSLALTEELFAVIDLTEAGDDIVFDLLDLADADIDETSTMIALMLPTDIAKQVAVPDGTPVEDMRITVTFNGDTDEDQFNQLVEDVKAWAKDAPMPLALKGTIGGLGTFPADDPEKGRPWYIPVDIPNLNTLHEQMKAVSDKSAPAAENHGYNPHVTLTYLPDSATPPTPVPSVEVAFNSVWVVRGNTERVEIPLSVGAGADETEHAILGSADVELTQGTMDIQALADRANRVADPAQRALARATVLDLASTIPPKNPSGKASDGRRRYAKQGKWGHGFVPLDKAAKESKAKGSPIAVKRLNRLFGKGKTVAATGRAGSRSAGGRKKDPHTVKVDEKTRPGSESAKDIGFLRHSSIDADTNKPSTTLKPSQKEASKQTRIPERARQNWDEIPETLKTVRGGKRYVLAEFGGKQFVTEWLGGINENSDSALKDRKVMRSITAADALKMSEAEITAMIANPRTPDSVKRVLRKSLKDRRKDDNNVE